MKIKIVDYSRYKPETCCNGGDYSFTVTYRQIDDDNFEVLHSTSSEFRYCQLCGKFYQRACPCGMSEPEVVDLETVNREISYAMQKYAQGEDWEISIG